MLRVDAVLAGIAPDLVQAEQHGVAVEQRVLQALGHHRAGELLETAAEAQDHPGLRAPGPRGLDAPEQRVRGEVVDRAVGQRAPALGLGDRPLDQAHVLGSTSLSSRSGGR